MKNKLLQRFALFLAVGLAWVSCTKNEQTTIVPIGTEDYIDDIFSVVSDSAFWDFFGDIYEGPIPPKIEGSYLVAPKLRTATNAFGVPVGVTEPNVNLRFSHQHNGIANMEMNEATENVTDTVFVMGNGQHFTVYFIENKVIDDFPYQDLTYRVTIRRGVVMTGTVDTVAKGLARFRMATIVLETSSQPEGVPLQPVGTYYIYQDGDGFAKQLD